MNDVIGTFMNECVYSYATIKIKCIHNPFVPFLFLKMICKKNSFSLVTGTGGKFRFSGDCFCSTSAEVNAKTY